MSFMSDAWGAINTGPTQPIKNIISDSYNSGLSRYSALEGTLTRFFDDPFGIKALENEFGFLKKAPRGVIYNIDAGLHLAFDFNPTEMEIKKDPNYSQENYPGSHAPIYFFENMSEKTVSFKLNFEATQGAKDSGIYYNDRPLGVLQIEAILESFVRPQSRSVSGNNYIESDLNIKEIENILNPKTDAETPKKKLFSSPEEALKAAKDYGKSTLDRASEFANGTFERTSNAFNSQFNSDAVKPAPQKESLLLEKKNLVSYTEPPDAYFVFGPRWWKGKLKFDGLKESYYDMNLVPRRLEVSITLMVLEDGKFLSYDSDMRNRLADDASKVSASDAAIGNKLVGINLWPL